MEALKLSGVARQGKLVLEVPERFNQQELEVIVLSNTDEASKGEQESTAQNGKLKQMLEIIGTAEYPNTPTSKYDVYNQ
jgi:hypothetical protein